MKFSIYRVRVVRVRVRVTPVLREVVREVRAKFVI